MAARAYTQFNPSTLKVAFNEATKKVITLPGCQCVDPGGLACNNLWRFQDWLGFKPMGIFDCDTDILISVCGAIHCLWVGDPGSWALTVDGYTMVVNVANFGAGATFTVWIGKGGDYYFYTTGEACAPLPVTVNNDFAVGDCGDPIFGGDKKGYDGTVRIISPCAV